MENEHKLKLGLLFGGRSGEHEVSLQSAQSIYDELDKNKYEIVLISIDKEGVLRLQQSQNFLINADNPNKISINMDTPIVTLVRRGNKTEVVSLDNNRVLANINVVFPVLHGSYGEDGTIQGWLEMLNVAYVGSGVLSSAAAMDKDVARRLLKQVQLPTVDCRVLSKHNFKKDILGEFASVLEFPIFVKPANLGSSVGISKVYKFADLEEAVCTAFQYDTKVVLEKYVEGREIEVSVLGNNNPVSSIPGEVLPNHDFYSYAAKYIDENGADFEVPARLSEDQIQEIQRLAILVFKTLGCAGLSRVDFFLQPSGHFVVSEINTMPGFTKISMYPKLWEASGIPYTKLLDKLITCALEKKEINDSLKREFGI